MSVDEKKLLDDVLQKILADNHIREDHIMTRIDALAHIGEENQVKMKEEIQASKGRMDNQIEVLKSLVDYLGSNNLIFHHDTTAISIPILKDIVVAITSPPPSSDFFPNDLV